jgi:ectoine hydroxylase-related dioxygenase (phytanoyl-CoA dioxygenase family)
MPMPMIRRDTDDSALTLDATVIAEFRNRGFTTLPQLSTPTELAFLWEVFTRLFAEHAGRKEGMQYDLLGHDSDQGAPALPTIINPVNYAPELRHLHFRANAAAVARQLLGPRATSSFEHAILKPARQGAATPWHQDEAYRVDPNFAYQQVSIWMPLQDATLENGCMVYIPDSFRLGVLPHRSPGNDPRVQAIECAGGFNPADAVSLPISAGMATAHQGRTLHFAGPNRSDAPRCAYILAFEIPPEPLRQRRDFYWNREKQAASLARKRRWRLRGGIVIEAFRKLRSGMWRRPARMLFELRRALRALWTLASRS